MNPAFSLYHIHTDKELDNIVEQLEYSIPMFCWVGILLYTISAIVFMFYGQYYIFSNLIFTALASLYFVMMIWSMSDKYNQNKYSILIGNINSSEYTTPDMFLSLIESSKSKNKDLCEKLLNFSYYDNEIKKYIKSVTEVRELRCGDFILAEIIYSKNLREDIASRDAAEYSKSCAKLHSL